MTINSLFYFFKGLFNIITFNFILWILIISFFNTFSFSVLGVFILFITLLCFFIYSRRLFFSTKIKNE